MCACGIPCTRGTIVCIDVDVGGLGDARGLGSVRVSAMGFWVCLLVKKSEESAWFEVVLEFSMQS